MLPNPAKAGTLWNLPMQGDGKEWRILILALIENDSRLTATFLKKASLQPDICKNVADLCAKTAEGCGAILLAEEALDADSVHALTKTLALQPSWSDVPIALITSGGHASPERLHHLAALGPGCNVSLLERPFRQGTLLSIFEVALRARSRQYQVRDLLAEREATARELRQAHDLLANKAKHLEQLVSDRTAELRDLVGELEAFSYSMAHDLRGPLRALQGYANILKEDYSGQLDVTGQSYLGRIGAAAERMHKLVRDVLSYSQLTRGHFALEPVPLHPLVRDIIEQYPSLKGAQIRIQGELPCVLGNHAALTQVIANLLTNAAKFVPQNRTPEIEIHARCDGDWILLSIRDNGVGIAPEDHERIFRMFERVHSTDKYEGTGIGLAIVRRAIERMNGTVGLQSQPGQGSTFWIRARPATQLV